jgi:hypothetical protein
MMKTVTLDVRSPDEAAQDFVNAWKTGKAQRTARISFATPELLWKVLTAKRWEILKAMRGLINASLAEAAGRVVASMRTIRIKSHSRSLVGCFFAFFGAFPFSSPYCGHTNPVGGVMTPFSAALSAALRQ